MRPTALRTLAALASLAALSGCGTMVGLPRDQAAGTVAPWADESDSERVLRATAIDVGQGDSMLIESPSGEALLIDAGPPGAGRFSVLPLLAERGVDRLTAVIVTHFHLDHYGGLAEIAAGPDGMPGTADDITIGGIYERSQPGGDGPDPLEAAPALADCPRQALHPGDRIESGDVSLEVLAADAELADGTRVDPGDPSDENAMGIAMKLTYGGFAMLFAADITGGGGEAPYQTPDVETPLAALIGPVDVLKVSHHGSNTGTNQALLDAAAPEVAIISVGDGNDFFHPHRSVIERLTESGAIVYQTERGWLDIDGPFVAGGDVTIDVDEDGEYRVILN